MRLKLRSSVDLPQPDGPMMAVTRPAPIVMLTSNSAWAWPYHRLKSHTSRTLPCFDFTS
jgi:hypothetical protein